jgi:predicted P-loop ATPase
LANVLLALREDQNLAGVFAFDEMLGLTMLMKPSPGVHGSAQFQTRPVTDHDVTRVQEYLQTVGLTRVGKDVVYQATLAHAEEQRFHPVRNYLSGLKWDGEKRISSWLSTYLGVPEGIYPQRLGEMFLISMVARIFQPGCKVDHMLVLEGPQGVHKSTACAVLGGPWFSDCLPDINTGKDVSQHLPGKWLIEISELSAMTKAEANHLKAFMTRNVERYRPSYGRSQVVQPRQCVFIGTTNEATYLRDPTGARRFWPVAVGAIAIHALRADRDQLFAEAFQAYQDGALWYPDAKFEKEHIAPEQMSRYESDPWEEPIRQHLMMFKPETVCIQWLLEIVLHLDVSRRSRRDSNRVVDVLKVLGWRRLKKDKDGNIPWGPPLS